MVIKMKKESYFCDICLIQMDEHVPFALREFRSGSFFDFMTLGDCCSRCHDIIIDELKKRFNAVFVEIRKELEENKL